MSNYTVKDVSEFIATAPSVAQPHLEEIRAIVHSTIPDAEEKIGYGKPYYKLQRWFVGFDIYKQHIGFEIWEGQLPSEIRKEFEEQGFQTGNKTVKIRYDQTVPKELLIKLIHAQENIITEKMKK